MKDRDNEHTLLTHFTQFSRHWADAKLMPSKCFYKKNFVITMEHNSVFTKTF